MATPHPMHSTSERRNTGTSNRCDKSPENLRALRPRVSIVARIERQRGRAQFRNTRAKTTDRIFQSPPNGARFLNDPQTCAHDLDRFRETLRRLVLPPASARHGEFRARRRGENAVNAARRNVITDVHRKRHQPDVISHSAIRSGPRTGTAAEIKNDHRTRLCFFRVRFAARSFKPFFNLAKRRRA